MPEAEVVEVSSTAEGASMVAVGKDPTCAAIASAACADVYGLELKAEGIQNNDSNKTRFYVLSMAEPLKEQADRLAFIVSGDADSLPDLMAEMEKRGMTLIAIHDRPLKTELGEYYYLIECTGSCKSYEALTKEADFTFRFLGSFPVR